MPLVNRTFSQLIDFTRTSAATYVDASGRIVPTPASRNLLTFTQEFDNAAWTKVAATVTANAATAPDGTLTADMLVENTAASVYHQTSQTFTSAAATNYTFSTYLKAGARTTATLLLGAGVNFVFCQFDLSAGTSGTIQYAGTTWTSGAVSITSVGNGWYRCSLRGLVSNSASYSAVIEINDGATRQYTGNGTSGIYAWGAQLEAGSTATDYTRNNGGVYPPRFDYDPVTLAPKGLLVEEQRTNLLVRSEEFDHGMWSLDNGGATNPVVTANQGVAPDGAMTADRIVLNKTGGTFSRIQQGPTVASAVYTFSVWMRTFSGSGTANVGIRLASDAANCVVTGTWQRFSLTMSAAGANPSAQILLFDSIIGNDETADILVWGAQLEAGSFATSYIPTVASQVTRTADVATITGANFSQWYNQSAGTFVVEGDYVANVNWRRFMTVDDTAAPANNRIIINGDQNQQLLVTTSGVNQASLNAGTSPSANTVTRIASAYALDNFAAVRDGGTVATDTSGTVPTVNRLNIGLHPNGGEYLNGHIRSIRYYPTRLSNAQLQALTA